MQPSTKKGIVLRVLKTAGTAGMGIAQIVEAAQEHSEWNAIDADQKATTKVPKRLPAQDSPQCIASCFRFIAIAELIDIDNCMCRFFARTLPLCASVRECMLCER